MSIIDFATIHYYGDKSLIGLDIAVLTRQPPSLPPHFSTPTCHMMKGLTQDQDPKGS